MAEINFPDPSASPWTDTNGVTWHWQNGGWVAGPAIGVPLVHNETSGRDAADAHPMSAITGLMEAGFHGYKNKIINGDFRVQQRGAGPYTVFNFGADHWSWSDNGSSGFNWQTDQLPDGRYAANITIGTGATGCHLVQSIEEPMQFSGKTITISFYCHASTLSVGKIGIRLTWRNFGSSPGNIDSDLLLDVTPGQTSSATFQIPDLSPYIQDIDNTSVLDVKFMLIHASAWNAEIAAQTGSATLTDFQVEFGAEVTAFERRQIQQELAMCQRYYWSNSDLGPDFGFGQRINTAINTHRITAAWPVTMRTVPAISNATDLLGGTITTIYPSVNGIGRIDFSPAVSQFSVTLDADAEI